MSWLWFAQVRRGSSEHKSTNSDDPKWERIGEAHLSY